MVFIQSEAILALEAAATSLGRPGLVAVNIVTSPYGGYFGAWLSRAGTSVHEVAAEPGRPITADAVAAALAALARVDLVAVVHAETSSGILNPLPEIAAAAHAKGALLIVDAVASVGGHALDVDGLGIDICVIGPQKALGGPAGLSIASISPRAWAAMQPQPAPSSLSLLDLKTNWLDRGRGAVPGMPSALEFWALDAALQRIEAEGIAQVVARHERAARAMRAGLAALGSSLWVDDAHASSLVTTTTIPDGIDQGTLVALARELGAVLGPGFGAVGPRIVRLDHTGARATLPSLLLTIAAYGIALATLGRAVSIDEATRKTREGFR